MLTDGAWVVFLCLLAIGGPVARKECCAHQHSQNLPYCQTDAAQSGRQAARAGAILIHCNQILSAFA
jgi:uncharacterized protein (DUF849 family)